MNYKLATTLDISKLSCPKCGAKYVSSPYEIINYHNSIKCDKCNYDGKLFLCQEYKVL
jgi:predicted RNA-binding Zn-ribbon protein involved in translation (DUF1610 family)